MPSTPQTPIQISLPAFKRVSQMLAQKQNHQLRLRIYITGGGCSGFQYGFKFEPKSQQEDIEIPCPVPAELAGEVKFPFYIIVDPMSMTYLEGSQLKFVEDLQGARFSVDNPNVKNTCGCGASFSLE